MSASTEVSVTWAQALAWRMERQLLDPVGSESVAGVYVGSARCSRWMSRCSPSSLSGLAVRRHVPASSRRPWPKGTWSRPSRSAARCTTSRLRRAESIWPSGRQAGSGSCRAGWSTTGFPLGLAGLPGRGARGAERRTVDPRRARPGSDEAPRVSAPEAGLRRGRGHPDQAADLAGGHELRSAARWTAHVSAPRQQPEVAGHPRP